MKPKNTNQDNVIFIFLIILTVLIPLPDLYRIYEFF